MDKGDLMQSEWRWQTADDYIAAVQAGFYCAIARGCTLGGSLLGKNYFFDSQVADRLFSAADQVPRG